MCYKGYSWICAYFLESFTFAFLNTPRLSADGPRMRFEHLRDCFLPDNSLCRLMELFQVCAHMAAGRLSPSIARLLSASCLLAMKKEPVGFRPLAIGEVFYWWISQTLSIQLCSSFVDHLWLGDTCAWLTFYNGHPSKLDSQCHQIVSCQLIFEELHARGLDLRDLIPFVRTFYGNPSPLFFSHHLSPGAYTTIMFESGTRQRDPLVGALFALAHFWALRASADAFPSCVVSF